MTTIVNAPARGDEGAGLSIFLGVIILILVAFFLFAYGLPSLRNAETAPTTGIPETSGENKVEINLPPAVLQAN